MPIPQYVTNGFICMLVWKGLLLAQLVECIILNFAIIGVITTLGGVVLLVNINTFHIYLVLSRFVHSLPYYTSLLSPPLIPVV